VAGGSSYQNQETGLEGQAEGGRRKRTKTGLGTEEKGWRELAFPGFSRQGQYPEDPSKPEKNSRGEKLEEVVPGEKDTHAQASRGTGR